ncbi:hypothetical protein PR202_gb17811 [Eleusine coracana subsp. coracana]|uniref:Uncharacterized protein n=1 Tax=Eleusine coracana subsp. coracana TaxID=191504 RepID=A0AAV5F5C1_ELECO|nr:hypothetical protein PR202_gb17811 [Eleusine coracana subsp. coracana]
MDGYCWGKSDRIFADWSYRTCTCEPSQNEVTEECQFDLCRQHVNAMRETAPHQGDESQFDLKQSRAENTNNTSTPNRIQTLDFSVILL